MFLGPLHNLSESLVGDMSRGDNLSVISTFLSELASQSAYVIIVLMMTAVVAFIIYAYWSIRNSNNRIRKAELDLDIKRRDLQKRREVIENLRNESVMISDADEEKLIRIQKDQGTLAKKIAYNIKEVEERTARLELGVETARLFETLAEVKRHETSLFDKD